MAEGIRDFEERLDQQPVDRDVFLSLFGRSERASTQRKPFEDAISKSTDILRKHPNSKWVDDAIMIIGKAWFFTLNFVGAEEKFNDILELDSPLRDEANFWLARTLIASGAYEEASTHLQTILSSEDLNRRWAPRYRLALAELHVQSENWEEAAIELEAGLEEIRDKDLAARAQFLEGQVLEQLERYADAVAAYGRVQHHRPFYELSYAAQFNIVRLLADHLDSDEAMRRLRRMERDDKNYDHRAQLAYLRGRVLIAQGFYNEALSEYDELLYDPTARGAQVRGRVHYALGTFYRDVRLDYQYAAAHFDTAAKAIKTPGSGSQSSQALAIPINPSPSAITDSDEQAQIFGDFSKVLDRIVLMDSLLYLGTLDDSSFAAVVLELRKRRAEEQEAMEEEMRQRQSESAFRGNASTAGSGDENGFGSGEVIAGSEGEAGFLYHKDQVRMQQAHQDFNLIWGDRPLAPNWRRVAAIEAAEAEEREEGRDDFQERVRREADMPMVDVSDVPRTQEKLDAMLTDRANARYELANVLFLSMNRPDSASAWYRMVVQEDEGEEVVQRAYYALAEVQRTLGDTSAANRLYDLIISDYSDSDLADQAHIRLGRPIPDRVSMDSLALAENAYKDQQLKWQEGVNEEVISNLFNIGLDWRNTPVAPRAFLASGKAYLEWATKDSADVLAALPISVSETRLEEAGFYSGLDSTSTATDSTLNLPKVLRYIGTSFEDSPQASRANRMLSALEEEKDRRQAIADSLQHIADSLAARQLAIADSIASLSADSIMSQGPDSIMQSMTLDSLSNIDEVMSDSLEQPNFSDSDRTSSSRPQQLESELTVARDSLGQKISEDVLTTTDSMAISPSQPSKYELADEFNAEEASDSLVEPVGKIGVEYSDKSDVPGADKDPSLGNIDWTKGGYTIHLISYDDYEMAKAFVVNYGRSLQDISEPMDIYGAEVQGGIEFRVGLGLFDTIQEAEFIVQRIAGRIPSEAKISRIGSTGR